MEVFMTKKLLIITILLAIFTVFVATSRAQYTGHELEKKEPENLYPQPGPGETAIIRELQETNRLLLQQTDLLKEQNRLLRENLSRNESAPSDH
jgi:hypothetical protein